MEESLYALINTEFEIIGISAGRVRFAGGNSSRVTAFIKDIEAFLKAYLSAEQRLAFLDMNEVLKIKKIEQLTKKVSLDQYNAKIQETLEEANFSTEGLSILVELVDEKEIYYIYDEEIEDISEIKYSGLKRLLPQKQFSYLDKEPCKSVYEPFNADINFDEIIVGRRPLIRVNTYKHPAWREGLTDLPISLVNLPSLAQEFFDHLFPDEQSREYVFDWIYTALVSRQGCEHILVLNGPTGTGKTIFSTQLMIALFREENWGAAPKNLFDSTFNSVLKDKRIIFIDEAKINERDYNTVKLYANKKLNVESKGMDANNSTDLYYSMILSNNKIGNIYVDPDDRRFSIVETTGDKLLDEWDESKIDLFVKSLEDINFIKQIGTFIISRHEEFEGFSLGQFKGEKFYQFVWRHLTQWQKIVCNRVFKEAKEGEEEIELDKLKTAIKNDKHIQYDVQMDTIVEFIESYNHNGICKLGTIIIEPRTGEKILKINENFIEEELIDELEESDLL